MPYTMHDFRRDYVKEHLKDLTLAERCYGLSDEERRKALGKLLEGLTIEQRLKGLSPEERRKALSLENLVNAMSPEQKEALIKLLESQIKQSPTK